MNESASGSPATPFDWSGATASGWLANAARIEGQLQPVEDVLFEVAAIRPGERVLDVGCGRGGAARRAAGLVGAEGRVTAVDISAELLEAASAVDSPPGSAMIDWVRADAETHRFEPSYDLVLSRFGVMFFADPVAAFANLRTALRPDGRLVVAVWQRREVSLIHQLGLDTVVRVAAERGVELRPIAPDAGPFSIGTADRAQRLLDEAGWSEVGYDTRLLPLYAGGPGCPAVEAARTALSMGMLEPLVRDLPDELVDTIRDELTAVYEGRWDGAGVLLEGSIALLTARP